MPELTFTAGLHRARRYIGEHPDELPMDPGDFGICCAYLAALVAEIEFRERQMEAQLDASRRTERVARSVDYRKRLRGEGEE